MRSAWLAQRVLGLIPTLLITWTVVFGAMRLIPGDPVSLMLGGVPASQEVMENERRRLGLDRPVYEQYLSFLRHAATGDFGISFTTRQPVRAMIASQLPYTLSLAGGGLLVGAVLGVLLGTLAGLRPNGWTDAGAMTLALGGLSLPSFWIGMVLIHVFGTTLGWVPIIGTGPLALVLPSITVGLFLAGGLARLIRASIIEVLGQDYIRTARAKGLAPFLIVAKHVGRNAVIPPMTLLGVQFAVLIGGAVVTERVFARPGIGALLVDAVLSKDYPLVQGVVVMTTAAYLVINLAIDLLYGWIDPRISRA
jgi:ABC-type dipeptide/oligopeptide/nickel transport system permease component